MSINSHISIKILEKEGISYKEIPLNGQDNSVASLFLDPTIRHTNIDFDITKVLSDEEIQLLNMKEDINNFTICSDLISPSVLLEMMQKIYSKLFFFGGIASQVLDVDLKDIDSFSLDEENKKERRMNEINTYMLFADTFGRLIGILKVAESLSTNVQIKVTYG